MPEPSIGSVPFSEAIEHFQGKLNIPTRHFDDLMGDVHARAFTVAGATRLDLLTDIRSAVDDAIANGTTIADFRKQFDAAVQKHGWSYKGKRGWRTRVIYDTNLRTAHMAGKWEQFQRVKETRPFLQYQTAGDRRVRPEHAAWDNLVLHIDDPWWDTHFPPNGWGCRCTTRSVSARQMRRDKLEPGNAPPLNASERVNTRTGEVYGEVPQGVDTGWDYNVGKAWLAPQINFGEKLAALPARIRADALGADALASNAARIAPGFESWAKAALSRDAALGEVRVVSYINDSAITHAIGQQVAVTDATVVINDSQLRTFIKAGGKSQLPESVLLKLPSHMAAPGATLWDKKRKSLVYVFAADSKPSATERYYVELRFRQKDEVSNTIEAAGRAPLAGYKDTTRYTIITGKL